MPAGGRAPGPGQWEVGAWALCCPFCFAHSLSPVLLAGPGRAGMKQRKLPCPAVVSLGHSWQGLGTVLVRAELPAGLQLPRPCLRLAFTGIQTQCYTCPCSLQNVSQHYTLKTILKYSFICSTSYLVLSCFLVFFFPLPYWNNIELYQVSGVWYHDNLYLCIYRVL